MDFFPIISSSSSSPPRVVETSCSGATIEILLLLLLRERKRTRHAIAGETSDDVKDVVVNTCSRVRFNRRNTIKRVVKKESSWSSCCFPTLYSVTRGGGVAALCSDDSERENEHKRDLKRKRPRASNTFI